MLELLFSALICVVEYSIFIMFLQHYLNDRWERSRKLFCFKFLGLLICSVTLTFINTFQNSLWNVLTVFTLTFILSCIFYQGKWLVKIFLAVEKYNGIVSIDYTDTIFTLAISIPLLNEQK